MGVGHGFAGGVRLQHPLAGPRQRAAPLSFRDRLGEQLTTQRNKERGYANLQPVQGLNPSQPGEAEAGGVAAVTHGRAGCLWGTGLLLFKIHPNQTLSIFSLSWARS